MSVALEKYRRAVEILVSGNETIRTRLVPALEALVELKIDEMPLDIRKQYSDICFGINSTTDPSGNGVIRAYVNGHREPEASALALRILGTYSELCRRTGEATGASASS
jgi:hypothetical protein